MNLLSDIGNSRVKWGCYENLRLDNVKAHAYERATLSAQLINDFQEITSPPAKVLVANVAGEEVAGLLTESLAQIWSISPEFIQVEQQRCGVMNGYKDISELGVDRWLATLAVWSQYHRAACIVDCGTALTFDVIDNEGKYQGGLIIPGPRLMQDTLINKTSDISGVVCEQYVKSLGVSTAECISYGAGLAATSFIDTMTYDMKRRYGDNLCSMITGGAANQLSALLENDYIYEPDLVLKGLSQLVDQK